MGKGAPPIGNALLMPSRLSLEPLMGRPPRRCPLSLKCDAKIRRKSGLTTTK